MYYLIQKEVNLMDKRIGNYSFIVGVVLAILLGLATPQLGNAGVWLSSLLVLLGLVVGFLNVTGSETKEFLLVATVLIIASFAGGAAGSLEKLAFLGLGGFLAAIFMQIMAFVVPATIVVGLKDIFTLAQNK